MANIISIRTLIAFLALFSLQLSFPGNASADISWMKAARECGSFDAALSGYLDKVDLEHYDALPFWQREELSIALTEACSGKFAKCKLKACKTWSSLSSVRPPNKKLAWLDRFLTCEQLVEQIQSRYSSLDPKELSSPEKKEEFKAVLDVSCSERFVHCKFRSCQQRQTQMAMSKKGDKTKTTDESKKSEPKKKKISYTEAQLEQLADERLKKRIADYMALQKIKIKAAMDKERESGAQWVKLSNPEEARIVEVRREAKRERQAADSLEQRVLDKLLENPYAKKKSNQSTTTPYVGSTEKKKSGTNGATGRTSKSIGSRGGAGAAGGLSDENRPKKKVKYFSNNPETREDTEEPVNLPRGSVGF